MKPFEAVVRVGPDGNVVVPIGVADAGAEVIACHDRRKTVRLHPHEATRRFLRPR